MHACMDGWMDGWMDGCMYVCMYVCKKYVNKKYATCSAWSCMKIPVKKIYSRSFVSFTL